MRIRVKALSIYVFSLFLLYLAGVYFGSHLLVLFFLFAIYPFLSLLILVFLYFNLKYHQSFSTDHPVKGESVECRFIISNDFILPVTHVDIGFKAVTPFRVSPFPAFSSYVRHSESIERKYTLQCPFRGIYTVGLEKIEIHDLLLFFTFKLPVYVKTFYVYPRILELKTLPTGIKSLQGRSEGASSGGVPDYSLFARLREYRDGEPTRHISWKKFASTGRPYLKEYEMTAGPDVHIFFDLRKSTGWKLEGSDVTSEYEQEDASIEILIALTKYFLERGISTAVTAAGREYYEFVGNDRTHFTAFYESTTSLIFQDTVSPASLYRSGNLTGKDESGSVIFITHIRDPEIFSVVEDSVAAEKGTILVFNQSCYPKRECEENLLYFDHLRNEGAEILTVKGSETILQDLERRAYAGIS